ncbi:hypothetical protein [Devosia salina]|uniref:Uncharacterized protein n=1 Tax=Devosia salina TaxID=2860336 RepID=A0ABX8WFA9_9HYPH|nr:hypothetical protein [Devosia salina]QYO75666.1 hypothetical protein K1X15_13615 [Devosia salina]
MAPDTDHEGLVTVRAILEAWSNGRITTREAIEMMELDDEAELLEVAADNGVDAPGPKPPPPEVP